MKSKIISTLLGSHLKLETENSLLKNALSIIVSLDQKSIHRAKSIAGDVLRHILERSAPSHSSKTKSDSVFRQTDGRILYPGKVIPFDKPPKSNSLSRKDRKKWMAMPNPLLKTLK